VLRLPSGLAKLFPQAQPSGLARRRLTAGYLLAFAALVLCALWRQPGVPATSSLWAEDGQVLYQAVLTHSVLGSLFSAYDGYLQLVPRLAIQATRAFPVIGASRVVALAGDAILAASALVVFHAARGHLPSPAPRVVLVAATVLLPLAGGELLNNLINSEWWLLFATFWLLLWRPDGRGARALAAALCFLAAASTPVVLVYAPIAAARVLALPRLRENAPTLGLIAGLAVQVPVMLVASGGGSTYPESTSHIASLFALRVGFGSLGGVTLTVDLIAHAATLGVVLGALLLAAVGLIALLRGSTRVRLFALAALASATGMFAFELWYRGAGLWMNGRPAIYGGRYVQTPVLLLLSVMILGAASARMSFRRRELAVGLCVLSACLAAGWVVDFRAANWRSAGPSWPNQVKRAARACRAPAQRAEILPIAPAGWSVRLPCADLR
jgi:hypothetical protein